MSYIKIQEDGTVFSAGYIEKPEEANMRGLSSVSLLEVDENGNNYEFYIYDENRRPTQFIPADKVKIQKLKIEEFKNNVSTEISNIVDAKAREYRYEDMKSARSYAGFTNSFQAEAINLGQWASNVWLYAAKIEEDYLAGLIPEPTIEEIIQNIPVYTAL